MASSLDSYTEQVKAIDCIYFTILGNDEVFRLSAVKSDPNGIDIPELYDNNEPKKGGLIDSRMGITDPHRTCDTCGLRASRCPGHFGHIELAEHVFHMGFLDYVKKIISNVCIRCSRLLVYKNERELDEMLKHKQGKARFAEIRNITKSIPYCMRPNYGCGAPVPKIRKNVKSTSGIVELYAETDPKHLAGEEGGTGERAKKVRVVLTPEMVYEILKNISDDDCRMMGINPDKSRPEMMILKKFPVPPVPVRPSVRADFTSSSTLEDHLTHKLADIIKVNFKIRKNKESLTEQVTKYTRDNSQLLQYHIATYYDNETLTMPKSEQNRVATKSISSRLKTKEGRIRGNLMGNEGRGMLFALLITGSCLFGCSRYRIEKTVERELVM